MTPGKETVAIAIGSPANDATAVPDDPAELRKLLLEERAKNARLESDYKSLLLEYWDNGLDAMVTEGLHAAVFLANPRDGKIKRLSDPMQIVCPADDVDGNIYALVFDRLYDPRLHMLSSEDDSGPRKAPRTFSQELRDDLTKVMRDENTAVIRTKRSIVTVLFRRKVVAILQSAEKGTIDVLVTVTYGLDHAGEPWLHVGIIDVDAVNRDDLTGLWRRKTLIRALERGIDDRKRTHEKTGTATPLSLLMFDIDHFKRINDEHGHAVGDEVIKTVARRISRVLRRKHDLVVRIGGEEFVAMIPVDEIDAARLAEEVRQIICAAPVAAKRGPHDDQQIMLDVTISIGCATFDPASKDTPESLLKTADTCLYLSKGAGRNRVTSTSMRPLKKL